MRSDEERSGGGNYSHRHVIGVHASSASSIVAYRHPEIHGAARGREFLAESRRVVEDVGKFWKSSPDVCGWIENSEQRAAPIISGRNCGGWTQVAFFPTIRQ